MQCAVEAPSHPPATFKRFESPRRISQKRTLQSNATTNTATTSSGSSSNSSHNGNGSSKTVVIITPTVSQSTLPTTPQSTRKQRPDVLSASMSKQKKTRRSRRRKKGAETLTTTTPNTSSSSVVVVADQLRRDLRRHKRPHDGTGHHDKRDKKMRWTECNRHEVSRVHRDCRQKGQPLAPYNTTQFIMNEHNAEKEIDFDQLSGQIQQMHNNRYRPHNSANGSGSSSTAQDGSASGRLDESNRDDYYYSSPEDESYFLEQQFQHDYNTMHAERLNSMSKSELLKEYLIIEKELELLRQKSPAGSVTAAAGPSGSARGDAPTINFTSITKSPRPPSMPSSPRGQYLNAFAQQQPQLQQQQHQSSSRNHHNHHHHSHHHHSSNGNSSSHNRSLKENKRLRKLLKQVYNRYNSLMYCINYVNNTNNSGSTSTSGEASAFQVDSVVGDNTSVQQSHQTPNHSNHLTPPSLTPDDYQMTNEMHYRIEKYISHPSPSPLSSSTSRDGSSSSDSYTSSSTSASSSTSVSSEEDGGIANGDASSASTPTISEQQSCAKRSSSGGGDNKLSTPATPTATTPVRLASNCEQHLERHYEESAGDELSGSSTEHEAREVLYKLVDLVVDDDYDVEEHFLSCNYYSAKWISSRTLSLTAVVFACAFEQQQQQGRSFHFLLRLLQLQ